MSRRRPRRERSEHRVPRPDGVRGPAGPRVARRGIPARAEAFAAPPACGGRLHRRRAGGPRRARERRLRCPRARPPSVPSSVGGRAGPYGGLAVTPPTTARVTPAVVEVSSAYRDCERITRRAAANFFYGIRLLPREKRQAMSAVYAFARCVDDIGDGDLDSAGKLEALAAERRRLSLLRGAGLNGHRDPVLVALAD